MRGYHAYTKFWTLPPSVPVNTVKDTEYEYFIFNNHARDNWAKAKDYNEGKGKDAPIVIPDNKLANFVDAIYESVKEKDVVHMITTGNRQYDQPYYRANYPYFNPEAEHHWVAVAGLERAEGGKYENIEVFNDPGEAKWWSVVAPGWGIYSSVVCEDTYVEPDENHKLGGAYYDTFSGTSMANPHVTGAMGVLASRYPEMTAFQVRDTMLTTANHHNEDGSVMKRWNAKAEGIPDVKYGWGVPDLRKGMFGPGQFLGMIDDEGKFQNNFEYELNGADIWSNDISQVAYDARVEEEGEWLKTVYTPWKAKLATLLEEKGDAGKKGEDAKSLENEKAVAGNTVVVNEEIAEKLAQHVEAFNGEFVLGNEFTGSARYVIEENGKKVRKDGTVTGPVVGSFTQEPLTEKEKADYLAKHPGTLEKDIPNTHEIIGNEDELAKVELKDAILWRDMAFETRAKAINKRSNHQLGLVKQGTGTLVMTGHNTYKGETKVEGGTLLAFSEAIPNGKVTVENGATFGLLSHYDDELTRRGHLVSDGEVRDLAVNLKDGGKFCISGLADLEVGKLTGVQKIHVGTLGSDPELLAKAYVDGLAKEDGKTVAGSFKFEAIPEGVEFVVEGAASQTEEKVEATDGEVASLSRSIMTLAVIQPASEPVAEPQALVTLDEKPKIEDGKVVFGLQVNKDASLSSFYEAEDENEKAVLSALATDANPFLGRAIQATLTGAPEAGAAKIAAIVKPLSDETVALARNVMVNSNLNVVNSALRGAHDGLFLRTAKTDDANLWVNTSVSKGHVKGNDVKLKSSFDTVMVGGDYRLNQTVKAGAFFGYGHDVAKESPARISQHSLHAGVYGLADVAGVEVTGVASWTHSDRKINNSVYSSELSDKADACSIYGEAGLPVSVKEDFRVTPYVGAGYMHVKGEDMTTEVAGAPVTFVAKASNLGFGKVGARAEGVVYTGEVDLSVKADAGYTHFFGDKTAEQDVALGGSSVATIKTKKLDGMFNLGLGMNVKFSPKCEGELSYHGDFGKAVKDNGVFGSIKVHF